MTKSISRYQAVAVFLIVMFSVKFNRLLGLIAETFHRDGWIFLLFFLIFDLVMLLIVLKTADYLGDVPFFEGLRQKVGPVFSKILIVLISVFFFFKLLLPIRGINDTFNNVIFDGLAWEWFSIPLLFLIVFLAAKGFPTIARTSEIVLFFVVVGFAFIVLLAFPTAFFEKLLPVKMPSITRFTEGFKKYSLWFGDFFLLYFFIGKVDRKHFKKAMVISQVVFYAVLTIMFIVFFGIMDNLAAFQRVSLVSITEASLLGFDLGRLDWILVLFVITSSVLGAGIYGFAASEAMSQVTTIKRRYVIFVFAVLVYILDVKLLKSLDTLRIFFFDYICWFVLFMRILFPIIILLIFAIKKRDFSSLVHNAHIKGKNRPKGYQPVAGENKLTRRAYKTPKNRKPLTQTQKLKAKENENA